MIKIIHTADWHIGQSFFGNDRAGEHLHFLQWLTEQLESMEVDVLLISGDVFDSANPSATSQRMFYHFLRTVTLKCPTLQIVITAGNHDSAARLEAPLPLLEGLNIHVVGVIRRIEGEIDYEHLMVNLFNKRGEKEALCMAVPYLRQGDYQPVMTDGNLYSEGVAGLYATLYNKIGEKKRPMQAIVAMGHLQATGSEIASIDHSERTIIGGLECVSPAAFAEGITYTALGHIHKAQRVSHRENIRYAGSPLSMSFAEKNYHHGVEMVTIADGHLVNIEKLDYVPLVSLLSIPATAAEPEEVLRQLEKLPELSLEERAQMIAPYLEVKVLFTEPEPGFSHQVMEIIKNKQVRLARIIPTYRKVDGEVADEITTEGLQSMNPLQIVNIAFRKKYQTEMPEELVTLFNEVCFEVNQNMEEDRR
ncbi:MAG: exonuclease SbcCD subunit D C-terminal domain-containing protein [Bacteroides sp.]